MINPFARIEELEAALKEALLLINPFMLTDSEYERFVAAQRVARAVVVKGDE